MNDEPKYSFFCDKLSCWRAFGVSFNWDDGIYMGIYFYKYFFGIHKTYVNKKTAKLKRKVL